MGKKLDRYMQRHKPIGLEPKAKREAQAPKKTDNVFPIHYAIEPSPEVNAYLEYHRQLNASIAATLAIAPLLLKRWRR